MKILSIILLCAAMAFAQDSFCKDTKPIDRGDAQVAFSFDGFTQVNSMWTFFFHAKDRGKVLMLCRNGQLVARIDIKQPAMSAEFYAGNNSETAIQTLDYKIVENDWEESK
jgi:hypothetical protein